VQLIGYKKVKARLSQKILGLSIFYRFGFFRPTLKIILCDKAKDISSVNTPKKTEQHWAIKSRSNSIFVIWFTLSIASIANKTDDISVVIAAIIK